jgi:integrase
MPSIGNRVKLTPLKIQHLKPAKPGQRYQVMDTLCEGFGVRVSDTGQRTFILRKRWPGEKNASRREIGDAGKLGRKGAMELDDAREKAREWSRLIKQGIDPAEREKREIEARVQVQKNTFAAVAEDWFIEKLTTERKGAEVERDVRNVFLPLWKDRPISEITEVDVLNVIRAKKRTAPAQARNLLGHAKRFFAWAVDQRCYGITASPCALLKPSKIIGDKAAGQRTLSDDEIAALWRAVARLPYPYGPVYRLLILSALRLNEAADAAKPEIDRKNGVWVIPPERMKGKNGKARAHAVPLTADILALFDSLPDLRKGPFLFSTSFGERPVWISDKIKKRIDARMLRTLKAMARRRGDDPAHVDLKPWKNHDIRRTVRSQLSRLKVTEEAREAVLAHARPGIKGTYDHHDYLDEKREALELWAARLRSIVSPQTDNVVRLQAIA